MIMSDTLNLPFQEPSIRQAFKYALGAHIALFIWNPTLLSGGAMNHAPTLFQVEFREALPKPPVPILKHEKAVVKKAHKSGLSLAKQARIAAIHPVKHPSRTISKPAPRSRPAAIKMPKFIPHAVDEDALVQTTHAPKLTTSTSLRAVSQPFNAAPKLHQGKTRGVHASDIHFKLEDRGTMVGGGAMSIPIGEERGETAQIASAAELHEAPRGLRHTSGHTYQAPLGEGVGELAGRNRKGYVAAIQVGGPSEDEVLAAGNGHGSAVGKGAEIGGPVGDRKILKRQIPEYPAWAEEKGISAIVKVFFTVRADGSIRKSVRIVHSSGYTELDALAKDAILSWKFSPTEATSSSEEAWGVVTFRFTLS
jgi:TonB family protein